MPPKLTVVDVEQGGVPKVQAAMELYNILSESNTDLRQPVGLEEQLLKDEALDSEVGQSMLQLLQVLPCRLMSTCSRSVFWVQQLAKAIARQPAPMLRCTKQCCAFVCTHTGMSGQPCTASVASLPCKACLAPLLPHRACLASLPCAVCNSS